MAAAASADAAAYLACCRPPSIRSDWCSRRAGEDGRISVEESLWGVIVTMGIAGMRDKILADFDVEWWILHFFCLWGVVSASLTYSSRFNDTDAFHLSLWALFLLGMAAQIAYLDHSTVGFASATAFLYGIVAASFYRVAYALPRARHFCVYYGAAYSVAAALFVSIATSPVAAEAERGLLWCNLIFECAIHWLFFGITETRPGAKAWDVPVTIKYFVNRYQGFHMMIIVCSFLFPISLQGKQFETSTISAIAVLLGNLYAVAIKLALFDTAVNDPESNLMRHAIRRSRPTAISYFVLHPVGMLGMGLSGVGFVAAITHKDEGFVRSLLCSGSAVTWAAIGMSKSLRTPLEPEVHYWKVAVLCVAALLYLAPLAFRLSVSATMAMVVGTLSTQLAAQLLVERLLSHTRSLPNWKFNPPRPVLTWEMLRQGESVGARVSGMEHFFSVLVAVAVFQLNETLAAAPIDAGELELYLLKFGVLWGMLLHTFRYASRYNDDDGWHKLLWAAFQFMLVLVLLGQGGDAAGVWSLYKVSTVCMFLLLAFGFSGRVLLYLPPSRPVGVYNAAVALVCAALMLSACVAHGWARPQLRAVVGFTLLSDPALELLLGSCAPTDMKRQMLFVPVNVEYYISRFDGLLMEVLGVAIVVPNCKYPGGFAHPSRIVEGIVLACALTLCLKHEFFDAASSSVQTHALRRSAAHKIVFFLLTPVAIVGVALTGGTTSIIIESAGDLGTSGGEPAAERLIYASTAMVLGSLTVTKCLHAPAVGAAFAHAAKATVGFLATAAAVVLAVDLGDFDTLAVVVTLHLSVLLLQAVLDVVLLGRQSALAVQEVHREPLDQAAGSRQRLLPEDGCNDSALVPGESDRSRITGR